MSITTSIRKHYARANGWFWLPCPLCGEEFAGYEWRDVDGKPSVVSCRRVPSTGHGICPSCTKAGLGERMWPPLAEPEAECPHCR